MSDEINWKPQEVADLATSLSRLGNEYRMSIANVYGEYNNMGLEQRWVGHNYNIIAEDVLNRSQPTFENWSNYLQVEIPQTMLSIAEEQANVGGGSVSGSICPNGAEIRLVQSTIDKGDGSQIIEPDYVRSKINGAIAGDCENAINILQRYHSEFQNMGTLDQNAAIYEMYQNLEEILANCKGLLNMFREEMSSRVEDSVRLVEVTDEETIQIANKIEAMLGNY